MTAFRRVACAIGALGLIVAACTSDPDEGATGGAAADESGGGSTRGLTGDTIKVGYIGADFSALAETGMVPDLGDQEKIFQSVVDQINEDGGIAGRQVEARIRLVDLVSDPQSAMTSCLEMTQDFGAFAVVLGPSIPRETARCTAVTNGTLTLNSTGFDQALYDEAEGRLFSTGSDTSMTTDRQYAGWARLLHDAGELEGRTIGIITAEQSAEFPAAVESALVPTLEDLGYDIAANLNLPCPTTDRDCEQQESAVQQLKSAGVDLVFMAAPNLIGPTVVQAAINLDYHPQWTANGNQVTDTVSMFFASVKDAWDGTVGTSTVFAQIEDLTDEAYACNETIATRSGEQYEPGSDAFGFAAVNCLTMQVLPQAAEAVEADDLDQGAMIAAIEGLGEIPLNAGPPGTLSADKHDAGDHLFMADYRAAEQEFVDRPDEPVKVD